MRKSRSHPVGTSWQMLILIFPYLRSCYSFSCLHNSFIQSFYKYVLGLYVPGATRGVEDRRWMRHHIFQKLTISFRRETCRLFFFLRLPYGAQGYVLKWEQCTLCERMEKDPAWAKCWRMSANQNHLLFSDYPGRNHLTSAPHHTILSFPCGGPWDILIPREARETNRCVLGRIGFGLRLEMVALPVVVPWL